MSLTKLSLGGNNLYMTSLFPPRESLVSDIPAGDGNIKKLFTVYYTVCFKPPKKLPLFDKVSPKVFAICEEGKQVWGAPNQTEKLLIDRLNTCLTCSWNWNLYCICATHTDKKENQIFLIKEIQKGSVAKSYMTITASSYMVKYLRISSYTRKPFLIYDFSTDPSWISLCMRKILLSFLSLLKMQYS